MRFINAAACGIIIELDATDCFALADACGYAMNRGLPGDHELVGALGTALTAGGIIAAMDTIRDNGVPEERWLEDARRVWAGRDSADPEGHRVATPPD
jgi:hypothetical protein